MASATPTSLSCPREPHSGANSYLRFNILNVTQTDGAKNQTNVKWSITLHNNWSTMARAYCKLGNKVLYDAKPELTNWVNGQVLASATTPFDNNSDGSLKLDLYLKQMFYYGNGVASRWTDPYFYQDASTTITFSTIPRYFSSTPSFTLSTKTETEFVYNWSTTETCSAISVSGTGTKSITGVPGTSGTIRITGLTNSAVYTHTATFTRSDSGLTTNASAENTTYQYPYVLSVGTSQLTIGDKQKLTLHNPLGRSVTINMIKGSSTGTVLYTGTTSGTTHEFTPDPDTLYATIPETREASVIYQVKYGSTSTLNTNNTYRYKIKGTENPVFDSSYIRDPVDTLHVNDITGLNTKIIKGHNSITGTIVRMGARASSKGSRYVVNATGNPSSQELTHSDSANKTFTVQNITNKVITAIAYDSRDLSTTATKELDLIDYSKPKVSNFTVTRQNGLGEYAIVSADGTFTHWSGWSQIKKYNSIQKAYFRYKVSTGNNWVNWIDVTSLLSRNSEGTWMLAGTLDLTFDNSTKYDFQIYVIDLLESSSTASNILSTANGLIWRDLKNKRIGINKKPEKTFDVNGEIACTALYINGVKVLWEE